MFNDKWKKLGLVTGLSLSLIAAGCGEGEAQDDGGTTTSVNEELEYTITGIEPGAGQTETNDTALAEYESLDGWEQETASSTAMLASLGNAVDNEEPIIVAAWSPHYKFAKWDLKYLEDPKGVFGEAEYITTIVREGLQEDMPNAYAILDNIYWDLSDMEAALLRAQELDFEFETVAEEWVADNEEIVSEWVDGIDSVDGTSIELATSSWDTEMLSSNIAKIVLEEHGFDVTLTPVDPSVLFQAIATGDADASLSPWMPTTHGEFYNQYEGEFEDLGKNLEGARIGLAVPTYMDINSIEDLEPAE